MKPRRSILDESFPYVSSAATSVAETWRRFGWRPMTDEERRRRRRRNVGTIAELVTERHPQTDVLNGALRRSA